MYYPIFPHKPGKYPTVHCFTLHFWALLCRSKAPVFYCVCMCLWVCVSLTLFGSSDWFRADHVTSFSVRTTSVKWPSSALSSFNAFISFMKVTKFYQPAEPSWAKLKNLKWSRQTLDTYINWFSDNCFYDNWFFDNWFSYIWFFDNWFSKLFLMKFISTFFN